MILCQSHVLVHVERLDILEGDLASAVQLNQLAVHLERGAAGRKAKHEVLLYI